MSYIRHYQVLPWATGPLILLESIAKVPDWLSAKRANRPSPDFLLRPDSTITAEAIITVQTRKNSTNHRVLHSPHIVLNERTWTSRRFSGNPTLMLAALGHFVWIIAITSTEIQLSMCLYAVYIYRESQKEQLLRSGRITQKSRSGICMPPGEIL